MSAKPWAPLSEPIFRALWLAGLFSNLGSWVHDLGASWLMTELTTSPLWVSLVQAAGSLPVFLLAVPAGALADVVDRRKLLIVSQLWMLLAALALALATYSGHASPTLLLFATCSLALGTALNTPAWQALVPELVHPPQLPAAIALNGLQINLARTLGPALGGILVSFLGPWAAFAFNAFTFAVVAFVLWRWKRDCKPPALPAERWFGAIQVGVRFVRYSPAFRGVLKRALAFFPWSAAMWAFLPLIARKELHIGAGGYGVLMGSMGFGAVTGALMMPRLRTRLSLNDLMSLASFIFAAVLGLLAVVRSYPLVCLVMAGAGGAWLTMMSGFGVAAQSLLPSWVRARGLAVYVTVFFGSLAVGSAFWGALAAQIGIPHSLIAASIGLVVSFVLVHRNRLEGDPHINLSPSRYWPAPEAPHGHRFDLSFDNGPILVRVEYHVGEGNVETFRKLMQETRLQRLRGGALEWNLFQDAERERVFWEVFLSESWLEHLRHHERMTQDDLDTMNAVRGLLTEPPDLRHLVAN